MQEPDELAALLDLPTAGISGTVDVGVQQRDGFGSGGSMVALALSQPVGDVVAGLAEAHGPPEVDDEGPPWLQGPRWLRHHEDDRQVRGAMLLVVEGTDARPPFVRADRVPAEATGFLLVDRFYAVRGASSGPPSADERPPAPRRRRGIRGRLRQLLGRR